MSGYNGKYPPSPFREGARVQYRRSHGAHGTVVEVCWNNRTGEWLKVRWDGDKWDSNVLWRDLEREQN